MELPTDEDWRDHAELPGKMRWTLTRRDRCWSDCARLEADYTVTYGSYELTEAADVLDAARRLWPLIERNTEDSFSRPTGLAKWPPTWLLTARDGAAALARSRPTES